MQREPRAPIVLHVVHSAALFALVAAFVLAGCELSAQEVRGTVRSASSGSPDASVVLVGTDGNAVAGALTAGDGGYVLRAPIAGYYYVRARQIGFSPDSSRPIRLSGGSVATADLELKRFVTFLPTVKVEETRRCRVAPVAGAVAFRLWQEAQSALTAAAVTASDTRVGFVLRRFEREIDPRTGAQLAVRNWESHSASAEPFASVAPESLAMHGFVVPKGATIIYYAPDARTLTSEAFVRTHCLRPVQNTTDAGLIGLAFEPVQQGLGGDVSGILWLDKTSAELRYLDFQYSGTSHNSITRATGRVSYMRLPTGAWIIDHWIIRMPVVTFQQVNVPSMGGNLGTGSVIVSHERLATVTAIWEAGGNVVNTYTSPTPLGALSGVIIDSTEDSPVHRGIADVRVTLTRARGPTVDSTTTPRSTVTDTAGAFTFDGVAVGEYILRTSSSHFDSLMIASPGERLVISAGVPSHLRILVPPAAAIIAHECPGASNPGGVLLHGTVRDAPTREVVAGAEITAMWAAVDGNNASGTRSSDVSGSSALAHAVSDSAGEYIMCGIPTTSPVSLTAAALGHEPLHTELRPGSERVRMREFLLNAARTAEIAQTQSGNAVIGSVNDMLGRAIRDAEVMIDSVTWQHVSDSGTFSFTRISADRHLLVARAVGYEPRAWYVSVHTGRPSTAKLILRTATVLPQVNVEGRSDAWSAASVGLAGFEHRRRFNSGGIYLDEQQIEARAPSRVTDLLRALPGVQLLPVTDSLSRTILVPVMRGSTSITGKVCPIQYYLDGRPFDQSEVIDYMISPHDITAMEIYPGASQVPPQFKGPTAMCGVIVVWTRGFGGVQ